MGASLERLLAARFAYGQRVAVRAHVGEAPISCGSYVTDGRERSYDRADFPFQPIHYLRTLARKTEC